MITHHQIYKGGRTGSPRVYRDDVKAPARAAKLKYIRQKQEN